MITRFAVLFVLTAATSAHAANVVVQKNGQFPTIQAGIAAAGAGGTVTVKAGVYEETLVVPSDLDGLTLKASGNVIIDARLANGDGAGPGLIVSGDDVVVRGFTIRHVMGSSSAEGYGVDVKGLRVRLEKLRIVNASAGGVIVEQTDAVIKNCRFEACWIGVYATEATRLLVENCVVERASIHGILVKGDDLVIRKNKITSCATGILVLGSARQRIEFNTITRCEFDAIALLTLSEGVVRGNKITSVSSGGGIRAVGDDPEITSNTIVETGGDGINVTGSNSVVAKNKVVGVAGFNGGIEVIGANGTIESNALHDVGGDGILSSSSNMTVKKNVVLRCGRFPGNPSTAFHLMGTSIDVLGNTAKDGRGDGFNLSLQDSEVIGNTAIGNVTDGFDLAVTGLVSNNVALKNLGEGFDLDNAGMTFTNNVAKNNRIDVAATTAPLSFEANSFGTGGVNTLPEID